jgi:hypothetical protein
MYEIINKIIRKYNYKKYLEIGVSSGSTFNNVNCDVKHGVDPYNDYVTHVMKSDEFFSNQNKINYDLIFIDGLHHEDQVTRDIYNSINSLCEGGTILVHDTLPHTELMQRAPQPDQLCENGLWTGDVWKAIAKFRSLETEYDCFTLKNVFLGLTVIRRGKNIKINIPDTLDYDYFIENKDYILNLKSCNYMRGT